MRLVYLLWVICMCAGIAAAQRSDSEKGGMSYELYSWRGPDGSWRFRMISSPSGRNIRAEEVFEKKSVLVGETKLKGKLSNLPRNTTVLWLDRIVSTSDAEPRSRAEHLAYPPMEVVKEIQHYAVQFNVTVTVVSGTGKDK
jgi:hypothetical protein